MATPEASVSLKLQIVVDKKEKRVLFAEADKEFVDFIFHILSLPLGAVQRILSKTSSSTDLGSIGTLQDGLKKLDAKYMEDPAKDYILGIKAPYWGKHTALLLPEASWNKTRSFTLSSKNHNVHVRVYEKDALLDYYGNNINLVSTDLDLALVLGNDKAYVKDLLATFMVMDDLVVRPAEPASVFSLMNQLSIKDIGDIEKRDVTFGTPQAIKLLKASISSKTVLTDVFLGGAVEAEIRDGNGSKYTPWL